MSVIIISIISEKKIIIKCMRELKTTWKPYIESIETLTTTILIQ